MLLTSPFLCAVQAKALGVPFVPKKAGRPSEAPRRDAAAAVEEAYYLGRNASQPGPQYHPGSRADQVRLASFGCDLCRASLTLFASSAPSRIAYSRPSRLLCGRRALARDAKIATLLMAVRQSIPRAQRPRRPASATRLSSHSLPRPLSAPRPLLRPATSPLPPSLPVTDARRTGPCRNASQGCRTARRPRTSDQWQPFSRGGMGAKGPERARRSWAV